MNAKIDAAAPRVPDAPSAPTGSAETQNPSLLPDPPPREAFVGAPRRRPHGFGAMDPKLVSEIARKGGKAAHARGTAHEFTSAEARAAGQKGGYASAKRRRALEKP